MFAPIYYPYLALIDSCMRMHFLNRVGWLVFGDNFWILGWLVFWDGGSKREKDVLLHHILWSRETHVTICWISKSLFIVYWIFYIPMKHLKIQKKTERQEKVQLLTCFWDHCRWWYAIPRTLVQGSIFWEAYWPLCHPIWLQWDLEYPLLAFG